MEQHLLLNLENKLDAYAASEIIKEKLQGEIKTVVYRKVVGFSETVNREINQLKDGAMYTVHCMGFVPPVDDLEEVFESDVKTSTLKVNVYVNEDVTGEVTNMLNLIKTTPCDVSLSSYMNLERNHSNTPLIDLLDVLALDKTNLANIVLKMTPFKEYDNLVTDFTQDGVNKVNFATKFYQNHINRQSLIAPSSVLFKKFGGLTIPMVNTIPSIKYKIQENLQTMFKDEYHVVGAFHICDNAMVSVSIFFDGDSEAIDQTAKSIAEQYNGGGNKYRGGFYIPIKEFFGQDND